MSVAFKQPPLKTCNWLLYYRTKAFLGNHIKQQQKTLQINFFNSWWGGGLLKGCFCICCRKIEMYSILKVVIKKPSI